MKNLIFLYALILTLFCSSCSNQDKTCIIKGKVYAPNCESVFLIKIQEDMTEEGLEIPVTDSIIDYQLTIEQPEGYNLFLQQGGGRAMPVFLEPGEIELIIYGEEEFSKNEIHGGKLNKLYADYKILREKYIEKIKPFYLSLQDSLEFLKKNNNFYSDSMKIINDLMDNAPNREERNKYKRIAQNLEENNLYYSEVAQGFVNKQNELNDEMLNWEINYYCENPTLVSYFLLLKDIYYSNMIDSEDMKKCLEIVSQNNPDHPYNEYAEIWLEKENNIKIGGRYIDFTAPDLEGNSVTLSDSIKGKFAIINLWSTTCAPCIKHSKEMSPIYNEYKSFGFTIVGVSGEYHNLENLKHRLDTEKFPWLNLVELDKQNRVWDKYGISNSGGRMFMVDREGIIIAIEPSVEEVRKILNEKLIKES